MNLELIILSKLKPTRDFALRESTLMAEVNMASPTAIPSAELRSALNNLDAKRQVTGWITEDGSKWKITAEGMMRLDENNL